MGFIEKDTATAPNKINKPDAENGAPSGMDDSKTRTPGTTFDRIANVYDETRRALDVETLNGLKRMLSEHGCRSILEIGVGTGRVAVPLLKNGHDVTGLDISLKMMEKAMAKGLENLVLASGVEIPFRDKVFDATMMAHVFHLLDDPLPVMREAARVSRVGVFALVMIRPGNRIWSPFFGGESPSNPGEGEAAKFAAEMRSRFRIIAEKYRYDWKPSRGLHNWGRELEILKTHPPDELRTVSEITVNEDVEGRIARFEKGAYSSTSSMPEAMRQEIAGEMRAAVPSLPQWALQPRKETYQVALWRSSTLLGCG